MASAMDSHLPQHEDLNMMGLHELDSHLMEFESLARDSPDAMSNSAYGDAMSTTENPSTMIVVDSPKENWARKSQPEMLLNCQGAYSRLVSCHILFLITPSHLPPDPEMDSIPPLPVRLHFNQLY